MLGHALCCLHLCGCTNHNDNGSSISWVFVFAVGRGDPSSLYAAVFAPAGAAGLFASGVQVRYLAAAVLSALLEGPAARSLLAVAEAKTAQPTLR